MLLQPQGEIRRILGLPKVEYVADGRYTRQLAVHDAAPPLLEAQETFLQACAHSAGEWFGGGQGGPGVVGLMSCGSGKTLALQLAPLVFGAERPVLLTEANLLGQLDDDVALWKRHYPVTVPEPLSYGKLSHHMHRNALEEREPDLILADEAHRIGRDSARFRRLWRYLEQHEECRFVAVTGTLWKRSVHDMRALMAMSLREWAPLPLNTVIDHWASVMDVGGEASAEDRGAVRPLLRWAPRGEPRANTRQKARRALRHRMQTCPGIVVTAGPLEVDVSLGIRMHEPKWTRELERLEGLWELPDGTELVDSLEVYRHRRTMRLGFWYRWDPATVDEEWVEARRVWSGIARAHVEHVGFDTPYFVEEAAELGTLRPGAIAAWKRWKAARETLSPPETEAVWVDGGLARLHALVDKWADAEAAPRHVVWYYSKAVAAAFEGTRWTIYRAGDPFPRGERYTMCPLSFHKGWNGHDYHRALVLEPPTGADVVEQVLARHHRKRQTRDVEFTLYGTTSDRFALKNVCEAAADVSGTPQRFLLADWLV